MSTQSQRPTSLDVLPGSEYHRRLLQGIAKSKQRVMITAMVAAYDTLTKPILDELFVALERGVAVTLVFDNFTRSPFADGRLATYIGEGRRQVKEILDVCDKLKQAGAHVTFIRPLGINHFKGRYHAKATIVDDTWFACGGINFTKDSFLNTDFMLSRRSREESNVLAALIDRFGHDDVPRDETIVFGDDTLLVDSGKPGRSIIYETALELAQQAQSAIYVSQMQPTGPLADALHRIDTTYYFNRSNQFKIPANAAALIDLFYFRGKNSYKGTVYIHAKYILFTMKDGSKQLISGSNNFHWRGVAYGTQEIALVSTNQTVWRELETFIKKRAPLDR